MWSGGRFSTRNAWSSVTGNIANPFLPKGRKREVPRELLTPFKFGPAVLVANVVVLVAQWVDR